MSNNDDEVQNIINQLKDLQLEQRRLVGRLERARHRERTEEREDRAFAIGEQVRIVNPKPGQEDRGEITKIGGTRVTVKTATNKKIQREPQNLIRLS